jgi:thiol-disulfide isomerase/thioredoxin
MFPHERSLVEKYKNEPFAIVGINSDPDLEKLKPVREKENISWRSFWNGPEGTGGPISAAWNVRGWPTLYILDSKGVIRYKSVGANEEAIDKTLEELLAELKQPAGSAK